MRPAAVLVSLCFIALRWESTLGLGERSNSQQQQTASDDVAEGFEHVHRVLQQRGDDADRPKPTEAQQREADVCLGSKYESLYASIHADLAPWREHGITQQLIDYALEALAMSPLDHKGAGVMFEGGMPYLLAGSLRKSAPGHHARLIVAHLLLFKHLSQRFGPTLPDVEFIFGTADSAYVYRKAFAFDSLLLPPSAEADLKALSFISGVGSTAARKLHKRLGYVPSVPPPMIRFCKAPDVFADILAPDIHFYMRGFGLVNATEKYAREFPWPYKNNCLFGRFSPYHRASHGMSNSTPRRGHKGKDICQAWRPGIHYCDTREHFIRDYVEDYKKRRAQAASSAAQSVSDAAPASTAPASTAPASTPRSSSEAAVRGSTAMQQARRKDGMLGKADAVLQAARLRWPPMDIAQQPKRSMSYHAAQRWLLHLDGQTCSSRLEQLLALGSLVIKEESGYVAFFHHLLQPYQHYLPMWKDTPADVEEALAWAMDHDPYYNTTGSTYPRTWTEHEIQDAIAKKGYKPGLGSSDTSAAQSVWSGASAAARIAAAGQALAREYLNKQAVTCYWFKLLHELSALHRFKPGLRGGQRNYTMPPMHVNAYLSSQQGQREIKQYFTGRTALDL